VVSRPTWLREFSRSLRGVAVFTAIVLSACASHPPDVSAPVESPVHVESPVPVELGNFYALLVSAQNYEHFRPLKTAIADAEALGAILESDYGFQVKHLRDAKREDIMQGLADLRTSTTETDNVLVYYAGHGFLDARTEVGYWLPVDAKEGSRGQWVSNADVTNELRGLEARHVLVVADSCYSGSISRDVVLSRLDEKYLKKLAGKRARVVITSGGLEPVADGGGGGHSVFAKYILMKLKENPGVIDSVRLYADVRALVADNADQTPEYGTIRMAGHEGGDFLFIKKTTPAARPSVETPKPQGQPSVAPAPAVDAAPHVQPEVSRAEEFASQALFEEGRDLMRNNRSSEACPKFELSNRLDPRLGTLLNMGLCYEKTGRFASALKAFNEAAIGSAREGNREREAVAKERAADLQEKVGRLKIVVEKGETDMVVEVDGQPPVPLPKISVPLDAGRHEIVVRAPGFQRFATSAKVVDGQSTIVMVPKLTRVSR